jgi:hypothetical protein
MSSSAAKQRSVRPDFLREWGDVREDVSDASHLGIKVQRRDAGRPLDIKKGIQQGNKL